MKIIVDVNLAVRWASMLASRGIEAVHWTAIGAANAQIRAEDTRPEAHFDRVVEALMKYSTAIEQGTIMTIDPYKTRIHILPFALPEK